MHLNLYIYYLHPLLQIYDVLKLRSTRCSDIHIDYTRNRRQFAVHGSVAAWLNIVFRYCCVSNRTSITSKFQTYYIWVDRMVRYILLNWCARVFASEKTQTGWVLVMKQNGWLCTVQGIRHFWAQMWYAWSCVLSYLSLHFCLRQILWDLYMYVWFCLWTM